MANCIILYLGSLDIWFLCNHWSQFASRFQRTPMGKNKVSKLFSALCARAETSQPYSGHCLRASHITWAKFAGLRDEDIVKRTGHRSMESLAKYNHPSLADTIAQANARHAGQGGVLAMSSSDSTLPLPHPHSAVPEAPAAASAAYQRSAITQLAQQCIKLLLQRQYH